MAIDYELTRDILIDIQQKVKRMRIIVDIAKDGEYKNEFKNKAFTNQENIDIKEEYMTLKQELSILYQQLP